MSRGDLYNDAYNSNLCILTTIWYGNVRVIHRGNCLGVVSNTDVVQHFNLTLVPRTPLFKHKNAKRGNVLPRLSFALQTPMSDRETALLEAWSFSCNSVRLIPNLPFPHFCHQLPRNSAHLYDPSSRPVVRHPLVAIALFAHFSCFISLP